MVDLGVTNRSRLALICSPEFRVFNNSRLPENLSMFSQYRIIFLFNYESKSYEKVLFSKYTQT